MLTSPLIPNINKFFYIWPGGEKKADTIQNMIGDSIAAILGWVTFFYIDIIAKDNLLYKQYLKPNMNKYFRKY